MDQEALSCAVGALLYAPAANATLAGHILRGDWPALTSVSLCLEDSIQDAALPQAEAQLKDTLRQLSQGERLPLLFVRVRTPEHLRHVHEMLGPQEALLTGYIFPKFDLSNGEAYMTALDRIRAESGRPLFAMPILESGMIASTLTRASALGEVRALLKAHREKVLNVRVGGNDFCNLFGLRRSVEETIYDLGVVRDVLMDILNVFSEEFTVSGPVWEYYGTDPDGPWAQGLRRELRLDRANGFLGKTAIHPSQLPLIFDSMKVRAADAEDAGRILSWQEGPLAVSGSPSGRMNEVKCHARWARRIQLRAQLYGIREEDAHADLV